MNFRDTINTLKYKGLVNLAQSKVCGSFKITHIQTQNKSLRLV